MALLLLAGVLPGCDTPTVMLGEAPAVTPGEPPDEDAPVVPETWLHLNEFMPANDGSWRTPDGASPDWVELYNDRDEARSLEGWRLVTEDADEDLAVALLGGSIEAGGFLVVPLVDDPAIDGALPLRLDADGGSVSLVDPGGASVRVSFGPLPSDFACGRTSDGCAGDCWTTTWAGTPGRTNVLVVTEGVSILEAGQIWRYWDLAAPPPADWFLPGFDDTAWSSGAAPLGYGDPHYVTVTDGGTDPSARPITQWFRLRFTVADLDLVDARLALVRDDGAAVYLDGVELVRSNLPAGTLDAGTMATASVGDAAETAATPYPFDAALLGAGEHVLAVEVHQASPESSVLGFDLSLSGAVLAP